MQEAFAAMAGGIPVLVTSHGEAKGLVVLAAERAEDAMLNYLARLSGEALLLRAGGDDPALVDRGDWGEYVLERCHPAGSVAKPGLAEAAVDLAQAAGLAPAVFSGEVGLEEPYEDIPRVSVADVVNYRWRNEHLVAREVETTLPTAHGLFRALGYTCLVDRSEYIVLVCGDVRGKEGVLTRVHSRCLTGDVLGSRRCDCGPQLAASMSRIAEDGCGVVTYNEAHEGRGIGLLEKLRAYKLQDEGRDTVDANLELGFPADARHYAIEAQVLKDLGVCSVRLLTNNPDKMQALETYGVNVEGREALVVGLNGDNRKYMAAKVDRLGHIVGHSDLQ